MKTKDKNNKNKLSSSVYNTGLRIIIFLALCLTMIISLFFEKPLENWLNFRYVSHINNINIDEEGLTFHFINVGQADCILIEFPTKEIMLVDSGDTSNASKNKIISYIDENIFKNKSEKIINYFLITHSDSDHVGGAVKIYEEYQVNFTYYPNYELIDNFAMTNTFQNTVNSMKSEPDSEYNYTYAGLELIIDEVSISFYSPFYEKPVINKPNNQSPIMIFSYMGKKVMLTGDAESNLEKKVLENYSEVDFDVDVLKVAHHGGNTSTTSNFLNATKPEYAIISVGKNSYGHPSSKVLDRLKQMGINSDSIFRTDLNGDIVLKITSDSRLGFIILNFSQAMIYIKWYYVVILICGLGAIIIFVPLKNFNSNKRRR